MENSPLSTLPPELRNMIYQNVLVELKYIKIREEHDIDHESPLWRAPALLLTCRQVRAEASAIHYSQNVFKVRHRSGGEEEDKEVFSEHCDFLLADWLKCIGSANGLRLRKLYMDDHFYPRVHVDERIARSWGVLADEGVEIGEAVVYVELCVERRDDESEWVCCGGSGA